MPLSNRLPIIGVPAINDHDAAGVHAPRFSNNQSYLRAVEAAGSVPILIPHLESVEALRRVYDMLDGILLTMLEEGNAVSQRVASYVREQLPAELLFDVAIPRTMASIDAFAAGQPVVLRAPDDLAALAYVRLAEQLERRLH